MSVRAEFTAALRFWIRRPLPSLASILSLAVGLAVAVSVFAVADAALWRPVPLPEPERVMWVDSIDRGEPSATSPGVFSAWLARGRGIESLAAVRPASAVLRSAGPGLRADGAYVSAGFSDVLGLQPALGRAITAADDRPGAPPVVLISDRLWRSHFAASRDILGEPIVLGGAPRTLVGIMPPALDAAGFTFDWLAPLALSAAQASNVGPRYLSVLARLGPVDAPALERELAALAAAAGARGDTGEPLAVRVEPLKARTSREARPVLLPLLAAVLSVVLLASLNAASLLLAQGQSRRSELAVRASLGASRGRILRQLALESAWLTGAAGALSLLLAMWIIDGLRRTAADTLLVTEAGLDARSVLFTIGLVLVVTLVSGLLPALRSSAADLRSSLAAGGRTMVATPDRLRRGLVVLQVGLALTIGAAGAVMLRTTQALGTAPRGYDGNVLTAATQFPSSEYGSPEALKVAVDRIVSAAGAMPGSQRAAAATRVPLSGGAPGSDLALAGESFPPGTDRQVRIRFVTPEFFATVGTPIVEGREVTSGDTDASEPVVLVNETLARRLGEGDPRRLLGRAVTFAVREFDIRGPRTRWSVVGIVSDTRDGGPRLAVEPEVYVPMAQGPGGVFDWIGRQVLVAVRAEPGRAPTAAELRAAVGAAEPGLALYDVLTLSDRMRDHLATERLLTAVLMPLAVTGFVLSAFGIFTLLMHMVAARRRELAIRMALGASGRRVVRSLLQEGFRLTAWGAVLGCAGAGLAVRALRPLMFGVSPADPLTVAALLLATGAATGLAAWLPARRAASVDPAAVLRSE